MIFRNSTPSLDLYVNDQENDIMGLGLGELGLGLGELRVGELRSYQQDTESE